MEVVYRLDTEGWKSRVLPADARSARERLEEGNRVFAVMFAEGADAEPHVIPVHEAALGAPGVAPPQRPFAAVLGDVLEVIHDFRVRATEDAIHLELRGIEGNQGDVLCVTPPPPGDQPRGMA